MARTYETVEEARKVTRLASRTCDLCGRLAGPGGDWAAGHDVGETELRVVVRHKSGRNYPDGGWGDEVSVDLCPGCFKGELLPWLASKGAKVTAEEWDW
jgi:hypothetical protein